MTPWLLFLANGSTSGSNAETQKDGHAGSGVAEARKAHGGEGHGSVHFGCTDTAFGVEGFASCDHVTTFVLVDENRSSHTH